MSRRPASGPRAWQAALGLALLAAGLCSAPVRAAALVATDDAEVIEVLPGGARAAAERRARHAMAQRPDDAALAVRLARAGLERSRASGDPREAGRALAALRHWNDPKTAPLEVLLLQATLDQHLHDFDAAAAKLEQSLRRDARQPQAWLTLATVRRVQGRYTESDAACHGLAAAGGDLHARACLAENDGLRGHFDAARQALERLVRAPQADAAVRGWLFATLAELEQRAGQPLRAEAAWRAALREDTDPYTTTSFTDFLLERNRPAEALALLRGQPASDAVVLRRAMSGDAAAAVEMRARFEQAGQRPDTALTHGRERALFALHVERDVRQAIDFARRNLQRQREPVDLLLLAEAARAAGETAALGEATRLAAAQGLVDRRWTEGAGGRP
ncbi:MAG: hypothetical protein KF788_11345 [Piscinibacter sp.]|nr:hypothetical protein [Piscinibacter sp.]